MRSWIFTIVFLMLFGISARGQDAAQPPSEAQAAIEKIARDYEVAFNRSDAKALAAMFAEDVEYTDADGVLTNGREAVEALLRRSFVLNPGAKLSIEVESVRGLSPDVAVERGTTVVTSRQGEQDSSAYTAVHVRKDGNWHIHELVESPVPSPSPQEMLSELAWMVGTWKEKDGDAEIETNVQWAKGENFLTRNFKVMVHDNVTLEGWQIIGWDAAEEKIRSWLFDSEGAFQEGEWTRTDKGWMIRLSGVLSDGGKLSSESTLLREGEDKCVWESTNRTLDGDPQPNLPRIEMLRVREK